MQIKNDLEVENFLVNLTS